MGKRSVLKPIRHTSAADNLLSNKGNHLSYVEVRTLRSRFSHDKRSVIATQGFDTVRSCLLSNLAEDTGHKVLQGLFLVATGSLLELSGLERLN
ncbi:unnamed protein product [Fusarium graminearum]|nr:unnamed protein product [Fusarium graminearum]CAG1967524.1 unnamed protein product [Fusarium graminearum]